MKLRVSRWVDTSNLDVEELPVVYGIQANNGDGNGWIHVAEDGEPLFFDTPQAAGEKLDELKSRYAA